MANFSPVSRAEISARFPEQVFLKRRFRLDEESFSPPEKPHVIACVDSAEGGTNFEAEC